MLKADTQWLLEQWARWAMSNPELCLDYPSAAPFTRLLGSTVATPMISDDQALLIDSAVARLSGRDREIGGILKLFYFSGGNISRVARLLGINRKRADVLLKSGVAWIDGRLSNDLNIC